MNKLEQIAAERRADFKMLAGSVDLAGLEQRAQSRRPRSLTDRLARAPSGVPVVIAESKKASPSAGVLCDDYDPAATARAYEAAGASALSVLTEPRHFMGRGEDLALVRAAVSVPLLCKDFMVDPLQVVFAAAWGADVILLIAALLSDAEMRGMAGRARDYGLEVLCEAHTPEEVERSLALEGVMIGVNSRDLKTLKTDLAIARNLASQIPTNRLAVAESGIRTAAEIRDLMGRGYRGFLIGESLLRSGDPGRSLHLLLQETISAEL
jgi:indole-3-glycerol phosphate synthase